MNTTPELARTVAALKAVGEILTGQQTAEKTALLEALREAGIKQQEVTLPDGSKEAQKILVYVKSGEPRYSVTEHGELLAHFIKRGGVGRRLAFQFKKQFPDTKEGRDRKATHQSFRNKLKAAGIPGA